MKGLIARQQFQQHQGMILTDKDAKTLEHNTKFKSVELNENFMNVDIKSQQQPSRDAADKTLDSRAENNKSPDEL